MFRELPRLDNLRLYLKELRIGVAEQLLVFLAPLVSRHHIAQRQQVGRLADRCLPPDGIEHCGRAGVGIDILHTWNKLVAHGIEKVGIDAHHGVESRRRAPHVFE